MHSYDVIEYLLTVDPRIMNLGRGQVVSVLAFYTDDSSLNLTKAYSFSGNVCLKRMDINKKRLGLAHLLKRS